MWQQIGQLAGGTVGGLTPTRGADGQPAILAITPAGGFALQEGGRWRPLSPEPGPALADVLAASPAFAQDGTLFAAGRTGVFRSTDGGRSWRLVLTGEVLSIAVSPAFADDQTVLVGTAQDGALRSDDGGTTWGGANTGLLDLTVLSVAFSPRFGQDRTAFVGTASALYRTRNGGRSWREVPLGLNDVAVQILVVSPRFADDKLVLAGTEADGLLRSTDGGGRFVPVPELAERGISALAIGDDGQTVVAASGPDLLRSDDTGQSWQVLPAAAGIVLALALDDGGRTLLAGLHRLGAARLDLREPVAGWTPLNDGLHASLLASLLPSPNIATDRALYGLSIEEGLLASHDGGVTWVRAWPDDADPSVACAAVAAGAGDAAPVLLASTSERLHCSVDGGRQWEPLLPESAPPLHLLVELPPGGPDPAFVGVGALQAGGRQAAGLVLSDDGGRSWRALGQLGTGEAGWTFAVDGLAASPAFWADRTLVARSREIRADGESRARLWRSTDGGRSWSVWYEAAAADSPGLPATLLMPPSSPSGTAIVMALGGQVLTPVPGSWERHGGQRRPVWHAADLGPAVASVTALAVPPVAHPGTAAERIVYAATNAGPFVSRDGGRSFRPWRDGYPGGGLVALAVSPAFATDRTVYGVGVGGSIWRATVE